MQLANADTFCFSHNNCFKQKQINRWILLFIIPRDDDFFFNEIILMNNNRQPKSNEPNQ